MSNKTSDEIDRQLVTLTSIRGVTAAAIVDNDGLVTHIRRDFAVDADAMGAAVQVVFGAARRAAENVSQGQSRLVIVENNEGVILLAPLSNEFLLAVIADGSVMLGSVRFEVKQTIPVLNEFFGGASDTRSGAQRTRSGR
ncbi:MAG: roadblock/LC7 domain-containing protein [Polyangiaceae bacterium]|nr:roadblock/LC7 domain-containing protein [Polyangiaceae bacterium]